MCHREEKVSACRVSILPSNKKPPFTAKYRPIRTWAESKTVILLFIELKLHKW